MLGEISNKKRYQFIANCIRDKYKDNQINILDVGCGDGCISEFLFYEGYANITAIDIDPDSIKKAKNKDCSKNINYVCEDINNYLLSTRNQYWDIVICSEVLEHLNKPDELIKAISAIVKRDGRLLITIPNGYGPWEVYHRISEKLHYANIVNEPIGKYHIQRFKHENIIEVISAEGFRLIKSENSNFISHIWSFTVPAYHSLDYIERIDCWLADYLPRNLASGWYFCFEPK